MDRTCLCSAADAPSDAGISHGWSSSPVTDAFHPRHLANSPSQHNKAGKQVKQFEFPIIPNVCQHMVPISAVWTCVCDTMWMFWGFFFYFPYVCSSDTGFFVHALSPSLLAPPSSHALSSSVSLSASPSPHLWCLSLRSAPHSAPPTLSPSILVLLFLATSQTSGRPRGLFPKRSSGVDSRERYAHSHKTHTHVLPSHAPSRSPSLSCPCSCPISFSVRTSLLTHAMLLHNIKQCCCSRSILEHSGHSVQNQALCSWPDTPQKLTHIRTLRGFVVVF